MAQPNSSHLTVTVALAPNDLALSDLNPVSPGLAQLSKWISRRLEPVGFSIGPETSGTQLLSPTFGVLNLGTQLNPDAIGSACEVFETVSGSGEKLVVKQLILDTPAELRGGSDSSANFRRFVTEAVLLAGLPSQYYPRLREVVFKPTDLGVLAPGPAMVMDHIDGTNLDELIASRSILPAQAVKLTQSLLLGLEPLHAKGFIHRDLKPTNVLVDEGFSPFILDLEGATPIAPEDGEPFMVDEPNTECLFGGIYTPPYCAPEVEFGESYCQPSADIFSIGVMLYEMLAQAPLGDSESELESFTLQRHGGEYPDLNARFLFVPPLPASLETIIAKATHPDPEARYQSVREFFDDLSACRGTENLDCTPWGVKEG